LRGDIQDLSAFLRPADIAIDPAFHAAPVTGRAATYLRHGIPSILTVEASRDLPGGAGEAYLLARSRAEFIAQLDQLLQSQALRQSLSAAAYRLAHRAFSPAALAARWGAVAALAQAG
jgi:glycosyltransferase involved in cell wall biosynthesis